MAELVEMTTDHFGAYETRWECPPPAEGVPFWVQYQTWSDDFKVRTIWRYTLTDEHGGRLDRAFGPTS